MNRVRSRRRARHLGWILACLVVALIAAGGAYALINPRLTRDDGLLPERTTIFDQQYPGIAKLTPDLATALREAAGAAQHDGVQFYVTSGWRSEAYQSALLQSAIEQYGSAREAARWVAPPEKSEHVRGEAVDLGGADALAWLRWHGAAFGLCQVYANEAWHYELRPDAPDQGCPPLYRDALADPRF